MTVEPNRNNKKVTRKVEQTTNPNTAETEVKQETSVEEQE